MTEQEKAKKLQEVFADEVFAEKIFALETAEEVQTALKEKGLELSVQEIGDIRDALVNQTESGEELDPEQLKKATGGIVGSFIMRELQRLHDAKWAQAHTRW